MLLHQVTPQARVRQFTHVASVIKKPVDMFPTCWAAVQQMKSGASIIDEAQNSVRQK
jgi:hypothetical protein